MSRTTAGSLQKIALGSGANIYGQVVATGVQLLSIPIFLSRWDTQTYGTWILLTTIPAYLSLSDFGLVSAAGTKMTILSGQSLKHQAQTVLSSAVRFVLWVVVCISLLGIGATGLLAALGFPGDVLAAAICFIFIVLMTQASGLADIMLRSSGMFALGSFISANARLLEWGGYLGGLYIGGSLTSTALGGLVGRFLSTTAVLLYASRKTGFRLWLRDGRSLEIRSLVQPSLGTLSINFANALSLQGVSIVVASGLGPVALVSFNTLRTLCRAAIQATSVISHALWPELSRSYNSENLVRFVRLSSLFSWLGLAVALASGIAGYLLTPLVLPLWTHGQVPFDPALAALFWIYAAAAGSWHVRRVILMSTNNHGRLGAITLLVSILVVAGAGVAASLGSLPITVLMTVLGEVALLVTSWVFSTRLLRGVGTQPHEV